MERTTARRRRLARVAALLSTAVLAGAAVLVAGPAGAADGELAANGGFESGLTGWSCAASSGQAVSTPVHTGTGALKATPAGSDNAQCSQTVTVQPNATYTLSAWVQGSYVYLGESGATASPVTTWTPSAATWQKLSLTFTTSATASTATIFLHGWYGQPAYVVDDVSLVGPGGGTTTPTIPAAPTGLKVGTATSSSVPLSWTAVSGATGYAVYRDGTKVSTTTSPSTTVSGLAAATAYSFQVTATNAAGESAKSSAVSATTASGGTTPTVPAAPTGLAAGTTTTSSVPLTWNAVSGATGYAVYRDGTKVSTTTSPSTTVSGLAAATAYSFQVTATNAAGESAKSSAVTATTATSGGGTGGGALPTHALVGYLHASFANGAGYVRMADVPSSWDVIDLAFGEPTSVTSGDIRFTRCKVSECPNVESDADFKAAIAAKRAAGKKVLLSIGGQNGQVQLTTTAARDAFVSSVSTIIDTWGLDGVDIDFEGHSLSLNTGDNDFRSPTTPVVVNLISALKSLKAKYGAGFVLTMAPETFFVQNGYQYYGSGPWGGQDPRCGAYLPVIYALRDDLTLLHVQDYNSGSIMGLDDQYHSMGGADFHIAMTDMLLTGFPVAKDTTKMFPALRPDQVAIGLPANSYAGNGYTSPADVTTTLNCLTKGTGCGSYKTHGTWPGLRGLMTWSINWDLYNGSPFTKNFDAYWP
ncbi:glycoside hydrolase family 18 protein [Luteimicrobium subarcticum]|uniref:chitinase n=1 Tax=Luteimicrobium subarcticum TaxID=620910 RepID=A0A2M8W3E9_9MICO|nr:glycoside hydrolase family 18 protein [Luteimicrobium subarcticum]PJI85438.1 chitinase [Luteimicrobium subarcticum]